MKHPNEFSKFLKDEVNLNQGRIDRLTTSVRSVNDCIKDNLTGYQSMERQGSYALGTLIKPVDDNDEYDADIQIVMNYNPKWEPKDYINVIHRTLKWDANYGDKIRRKTRCVTVDYAGDFHLDAVPRITYNGAHWICNSRENKFELTDGTGYREWFNEQNRITGGNLKRVVRLLKYLRDHKSNYTVKSILLTTLAGMMIYDEDEETEAVKTVADTLTTVMSRMDDYLQMNPNMPEIRNPALASETFTRHWDQRMYANFRDRVHSQASVMKNAKDSDDKKVSLKLWRSLFSESFGKSSNGGGGGGNSPKGGNGGSGGRQTNYIGQGARVAPVVAVRPRKPYAAAQNASAASMKTITLSAEDTSELNAAQPELSYDAANNRIIGNLKIASEYNQSDGWLKTVDSVSAAADPGMFIQDSFSIEVRLRYRPANINPWPIVVETGGRVQKIMAKREITEIMDLHIYPNKPENICCLGIKAPASQEMNPLQFIQEIVVPFFYRLAYVGRHGLAAARTNLWGEYSHGQDGLNEYESEIRALRKIGRNEICPCGSGRKHKRCCFDEARSAIAMLQTNKARLN